MPFHEAARHPRAKRALIKRKIADFETWRRQITDIPPRVEVKDRGAILFQEQEFEPGAE
jgi:hypothetical protein